MRSNFELNCGSTKDVTAAEEDQGALDRLDCIRQTVFGLDEIFEIILQKLSVPHLLQTSLVSTRWAAKSRRVLQDKKICALRIQGKDTCAALKRLDSLLQHSMAIPFNGLSIRANFFSRSKAKECLYCPDIRRLYPVLTSIRIKYLRIDWFELRSCPSWALLKHILEEYAWSIQILAVSSPLGMTSLARTFEVERKQGDCWLPNLGTFDVELPPDSDFYPLMSEMFEGAPCLTQIFGSITPEKLEFLLHSGQAKNVKELWLCPIASQLNVCKAFALAAPKLRKLYLSTERLGDGDSGGNLNFMKLLQVLILNCCSSLEELVLGRRDFMLLVRSIFDVLEDSSLKHRSFSEGIRIPQGINTRRLFPKLNFVELYSDANISDFVASLRESSQCLVFGSVKKLRILQRFQISCLTALFPNVTDLELANVPELASYLPEIWTAWRRLEYLTFDYVNRLLVTMDVNAAFCGLSGEELEVLKSAERDVLEEIHLVPSAPSVRDLSYLKKLRLQVTYECHDGEIFGGKTPFLSQITGHLVFSRLPQLTVEFSRKDYCFGADDFGQDWYTMESLKPFVRFVNHFVYHNND